MRDHATIERELAAHDERLARLPRVLALSKGDLVTGERAAAAAAEWEGRLGGEVPVIVTSSATGAGFEELAGELSRRVAPRAAGEGERPRRGARAGCQRWIADMEDLAEYMVFRPNAGRGFQVRADRGGGVRGQGQRGRTAAAALRRRERGRDGLPGGTAAADRRARGAGGGGVSARRRARGGRRHVRARRPTRHKLHECDAR